MMSSISSKNKIFCISENDIEKTINVNLEQSLGSEHNSSDFVNYFKEAFKVERQINGAPKKIVASNNVLIFLDEWLYTISFDLQNSDRCILNVALEILRALRNCTSGLEIQNFIATKTNILNTCRNLFDIIIGIDKNHVCLKVLLQFLINMASSNKEVTQKIYQVFFEIVKTCIKDRTHLYESSALIYNISLAIPINDVEVIHEIFEVYSSESHNEYVHFLLENHIVKHEFWNMFRFFKTENKVTALEIIKDMAIRKTLYNLPQPALDLIIKVFLESNDIIFQLNMCDTNNLKIYEVSLILEILSSLSSNEEYLEKFQGNKAILINAGILLINVHRLGKVSDNCFTPVQNLSEFGANQELNQHPAFGFKADLVRLIGNLCWKNMEMQNLARTAELIPVILECCNMDARNPFIPQWSILAIRNLCKTNQENQKVIAGLHQEGTVSSRLLDEMGITLQSDGKDLKITPLKSLRK